MSRLEYIRDEASKKEAYWRARRFGALRIGLEEAKNMGMTAAEASEYLGIKTGSVYVACYRYGIKLPRAKSLVQHHRTPKIVVPIEGIEVFETVRETAIANRGKASASQIAAAIGVSRNSIIGHWFRARQSEAA